MLSRVFKSIVTAQVEVCLNEGRKRDSRKRDSRKRDSVAWGWLSHRATRQDTLVGEEKLQYK